MIEKEEDLLDEYKEEIIECKLIGLDTESE